MVRRDAPDHATKSEGFCLLAILVANTLNWQPAITTL